MDAASVERSGDALQRLDTGGVDLAHHGDDVGGELIGLGSVAGGAIGALLRGRPWALPPGGNRLRGLGGLPRRLGRMVVILGRIRRIAFNLYGMRFDEAMVAAFFLMAALA